MSTIVTLDTYSGRPNPSWVLSDAHEKELNERMAALATITESRPSGVAGGLGYRGMTVAQHVENAARTSRFMVHENIVDRGLGQANYVADSDLESWLITTSESTPQVTDELREHVSSRFNLQQTERFAAATKAATGCPPCKAADAPAYNPGAWNIPSVQPYNNCYNYANNQATNTFAQPGRATGHPITALSCPGVTPSAISDGLVTVPNFSGPLPAGKGWYVALVIWPGNDYHWYRQDNVGCWSHKPGSTAVRNVDNAGNPITDPKTCNRGPYTVFCCYMVTNRGVHIR